MLLGTKGEKLVAIASGYSAGIEVWNPTDGSVKTLNATFPMSGKLPSLISVRSQTELILYESCQHTGNPRGIWKLILATNTWIKIGYMLAARRGSSGLPVEGIFCP